MIRLVILLCLVGICSGCSTKGLQTIEAIGAYAEQRQLRWCVKFENHLGGGFGGGTAGNIKVIVATGETGENDVCEKLP